MSTFFEFSLCLSRACPGKMFVFIFKTAPKRFGAYVCPEPVLVKCSFLYNIKNGSKSVTFSYRGFEDVCVVRPPVGTVACPEIVVATAATTSGTAAAADLINAAADLIIAVVEERRSFELPIVLVGQPATTHIEVCILSLAKSSQVSGRGTRLSSVAPLETRACGRVCITCIIINMLNHRDLRPGFCEVGVVMGRTERRPGVVKSEQTHLPRFVAAESICCVRAQQPVMCLRSDMTPTDTAARQRLHVALKRWEHGGWMTRQKRTRRRVN